MMIAKEKIQGQKERYLYHPPLSKSSASQPVPLLNDLHRRRIVPTAMRFHHNLDILIEGYQEAQQAFDGELAELAAQHLRDIWLANSEQLGSFHLLEAASFQDCVNLENQLCLNLMLLGVRHTDVLKDIIASNLMALFAAHCCPPLAICSASRNLCLINSMSRPGVCLPLFDFFWKACRT